MLVSELPGRLVKICIARLHLQSFRFGRSGMGHENLHSLAGAAMPGALLRITVLCSLDQSQWEGEPTCQQHTDTLPGTYIQVILFKDVMFFFSFIDFVFCCCCCCLFLSKHKLLSNSSSETNQSKCTPTCNYYVLSLSLCQHSNIMLCWSQRIVSMRWGRVTVWSILIKVILIPRNRGPSKVG